MFKPFTDSLKNSEMKIAELISDGTGFMIGTPEDKFQLIGQEGNRWAYINKEKSLKIEKHVKISEQAVIISSCLENIGFCISDPIKMVEPLNLVFSIPHDRWRHLYSNGGTSEDFYPPAAYRTQEYSHGTGKLVIESHPGGRSSNLHLPFLISLISFGEDYEGFFCGMEWSASWYISFENIDNNSSRIVAGIKVNNLILEPGEVLKLPDVHIGFFAGGPDEATNILRRYLYENVCAKYQQKLMIPLVSYDHWFGIENRLNYELLKKQAVKASELGVEIFVIDAGWFIGEFPDGVGNWDEVDKRKFPDGLEPFSDFINNLGMGLGLWFEPEKAAAGTSVSKINPDWIVEVPRSWFCNTATFHLNLARTDVQDYLIDIIGGWIKRLNLKWSRWDYNIEPMEFWTAIDPTLKIQFGYIKGLYRVLDHLMKKYPGWMVEGCASGGCRIDIGTMKRAHAFWISDQSFNPLICRHMQARANRFLPGHLLNSSIATGYGKGSIGLDDTAILSRMLGKLAFDGDIASWSPEFADKAAVWVKEFKKIRHLLVQDFFQLLPMPMTSDDWDAVQFIDYSRNEAVLFVFCGDRGGDIFINLKGLDNASNYSIIKKLDGESKTMKGFDLMNNGFTAILRANESGLWHLKKLE